MKTSYEQINELENIVQKLRLEINKQEEERIDLEKRLSHQINLWNTLKTMIQSRIETFSDTQEQEIINSSEEDITILEQMEVMEKW